MVKGVIGSCYSEMTPLWFCLMLWKAMSTLTSFLRFEVISYVFKKPIITAKEEGSFEFENAADLCSDSNHMPVYLLTKPSNLTTTAHREHIKHTIHHAHSPSVKGSLKPPCFVQPYHRQSNGICKTILSP
jgi:hypothetical protein